MPVFDEQRRFALSVGVSRYGDDKLPPLPHAVDAARKFGKALDASLFRGARTLVDPQTSLDLFNALQKGMHEAAGGAFVFYFAGYVLERDGDLLLAVRETEADPPKGAVPWSDVEVILKGERIQRCLVILNAERLAVTAPTKAIRHPNVMCIGSVRKLDPAKADARLQGYGEALVSALGATVKQLEPYLTDGGLDAMGFERFLATNAKSLHDTKIVGAQAGALVLRDLREQLAATKPKVEAKKPEPVVEAKPEPVIEAKPEPVIEAKPEPIVEPTPEPLAEAPLPAPPLMELADQPMKAPIESPKAEKEGELVEERESELPGKLRTTREPTPGAPRSSVLIWLLVLIAVAALIYFLTRGAR